MRESIHANRSAWVPHFAKMSGSHDSHVGVAVKQHHAHRPVEELGSAFGTPLLVLKQALAGSAARATAATIMVPVDTIKTRLQFQVRSSVRQSAYL